ncbi:MAG: hypothetical protein ACXIUP_01625, partial [Microcella sp.]
MLAQRAARILASRHPAPEQAASAPPLPSAVPAAPSPRLREASPPARTANPHGVADGAVEKPAPRGRRRPPARWLAITAVVITGLVALALVAQPREPAAFAVFDEPASARERVLEERLAGTGGLLVSGVRVLQSSVLTQPGELLELVAYRGGASPRVAPSERTVCLAVFAADRLQSRTCVAEPAFVGGDTVSVAESLPGAELYYSWGADDDARVRLTPTGPTELVELSALGLPAIRELIVAAEDGPRPLVRTIDQVTRPSGRPEALIGPAELTRVEQTWILIGAVRRSPTPGGELEVCAIATRIGVASAPIDSRCVTASEFARAGIATPPADGLRPFVYAWRPDGTIELEGLTSTT